MQHTCNDVEAQANTALWKVTTPSANPRQPCSSYPRTCSSLVASQPVALLLCRLDARHHALAPLTQLLQPGRTEQAPALASAAGCSSNSFRIAGRARHTQAQCSVATTQPTAWSWPPAAGCTCSAGGERHPALPNHACRAPLCQSHASSVQLQTCRLLLQATAAAAAAAVGLPSCPPHLSVPMMSSRYSSSPVSCSVCPLGFIIEICSTSPCRQRQPGGRSTLLRSSALASAEAAAAVPHPPHE